MAGFSGYFSTAQVRVYIAAGHLSGTPAWADVVGTGKVVTTDQANRASAVSIGGGTATANTIAFRILGDQVETRLPDVPSQDDLTITLAFDPSNTLAKGIENAAIGAQYTVVRTFSDNVSPAATDAKTTIQFWNVNKASSGISTDSGTEGQLVAAFTPVRNFALLDKP